uniref:DNA-directed DNA polymerase n=1 Tax=Panagrolaimus davidi TaxID=227884 RepID=A0A914QJN6_9BILA
MEALAKRRKEEHEQYRIDKDFDELFKIKYPEFCNVTRLDEKNEVANVGIMKFYFEIIFNTNITNNNPRQIFLDKIQEAIDMVKKEVPEGKRLGLILKSISSDSKIAHDLHVPWGKYSDDIVQFFSNRMEQLHESNEIADIFSESFLLEITVFQTVLSGNGDREYTINNKNLINPGGSQMLCLFTSVYGLIELVKIDVKAKEIAEQKRIDKANNVRRRGETPFNQKERRKMIINLMENPDETFERKIDQFRRNTKISRRTLENPNKVFKKSVDSFRAASNIPENCKGYGSLEHFEKIQDYLNVTYDETYRLVVFDYYYRKKPEFKGCAKNVKYDIGILYYQNHFYAISNITRSCFIQPIEEKDIPDYRMVIFDFEARQDLIVGLGKREHTVNYCAAYISCTKCLDNGEWANQISSCDICGDGPRMKEWSGLDESNCLSDFLDWLFAADSLYETFALAHYSGRYDAIFILRELFRRKIGHLTEPIKVGNKFYSIKVKKTDNTPQITFKDSFNYLPIPLSEMVSTFSLEIEEKQWFPHTFNTVANYNVELPTLPNLAHYCPNTMSVKKRAAFMEWYNANWNTPFSLKTQLPLYCKNDVNILTWAVVKFREMWMKNFEVDPIYHCATIASACMRSFRKKHLQANSLPIVPEGGYHRHSRASEAALRYFYWRRKTTGETIQFHDSPEGEKVIGRFKVDGFIEETNTVIEWNGCAYHGCLDCFSPDTRLPTGLQAIDQYELTKEKENILIAMGYNVESIWECKVNKMIKNFDAKTRVEYEKQLIVGPLNPRDAYFGGRTGPLSLFEEITTEEEATHDISLCDIRSLYPSVNFNTEYPVGLPQLIDIPPNEQNVNWTRPEQNKYRGLIKCFVVPPRTLNLPVIPYKNPTELFAPYVRDCLKLKVENDNFPVNVLTLEEEDNFIQVYRDRFGIILDREQIRRNPGLRYLAKLAANSMWGRFSLRNNLAKTVIVSTGMKANAILENDKYVISTVDILNECEVMITYTMHKDFISENAASNIIVSLWTTSAARVVLYRLMEMVDADPNCKLLYTDTDSILLKHLKGLFPFPLGDYLGDMALEISNIKEYASGGCKQYGLKIINPNTGEIEYILKIRGISLTAEVARELHYEKFSEMVKDYGNNEKLNVPVTRIVPHRTGHVYTMELTKVYRAIFQKGIICDNYEIIPFGF